MAYLIRVYDLSQKEAEVLRFETAGAAGRAARLALYCSPHHFVWVQDLSEEWRTWRDPEEVGKVATVMADLEEGRDDE